ncbi:hypothetical protein B0H13DRAFT_1627864 [Mycena leptocephala]|nr:hypothetical protein B0H13DRAFT_1627864 [Mycena leptocephala]
MGTSLSTTYVSNWQETCASTFNCTSAGLLNVLGEAITCPADGKITADVWGITMKACEENCGFDVLRQSVDFTTSAITITTWLLPWLALIAQLPFEAHGWMNILSGCLCVGSPALAAYSIALTVFNRWYISLKFQRLRSSAAKDTLQEYQYMVERVEAAEFILQEVQPSPMRANQRTGELANLIVLNDPHRQNFWKTAAKDLSNTRRGFTYSFLAQVLMAFLAYLISFIAAVHDSLGSPDVGLQFASSSVWSWMFPIVFGSIRVGSQYKAGSVKEALTDNMIIPERDVHGQARYARLQEPSLTDEDEAHETYPLLPFSVDTRRLESALPPPTWLGFDIRGDERREGSIFNYARIFTWFAFAEHLGRGFENSINSFRAGAAIPSTTEEAAALCGFKPQEDLVAFTAWSELPTPAIQHMLAAAFLALFLQWGTTGSAIFVAYSTPAVGLGCRSGSYLIYGVAATASWLLLVFSNLVSHTYMQRLEHNPHYRGRTMMTFFGALAVITRHLGKAIAVTNAAWLIASSVMEDIGTFQTCWCQTDAFQYHENGWTAVFKNASDLRSTAGGIWIGGFLWSLVVCVVTAGVFAYDRK